jgi:hypothetical protein
MNDVVVIPELTTEEDTFCLAVIEYGGNLPAAMRAAFGDDVKTPIIRANELLARPEIAKRVMALGRMVEEHAFVSLGSHLAKLAELRDLAADNKQFKVALDAEKTRGLAAGLYGAQGAPKDPGETGKSGVHIYIAQSTPANVNEWAQRRGTAAVVLNPDGSEARNPS